MAPYLEVVPLLQLQRELYDVPRGWERFRAYLKTMTGEGDELVLPPLVVMNPMGKEHIAAYLDELLSLGAETTASEAISSALPRLIDESGELKIGFVVADDAHGGWTNRYFTDMAQKFENTYSITRNWTSAIFWTSENPSKESIRTTVLSAIYRTFYIRRHGLAKTLGDMMSQEGSAAAFSGQTVQIDPPALQHIKNIVGPRRASAAYPVIVACLYGDDAAVSVGYPPLGLPANAGYRLALAEAQSVFLADASGKAL